MVKAFWFMIKVGLLVALAVWVADHPGYVLIEFPDHAFKARVHTGLFLLILLGTILLAIFLFRIIHWIANFPNTWRKYRAYQRREKGYRALTLGLTAVAAGDQKQAAYHAARAEKFLPGDHGLPVLLMAQSQRLQGLEAEAAQSFRRLLENKDTSFLGVRGLLQAALDHENFAQALELSYEALALHPKQKWILCTVYDLELRQHRWEQAKAILKRAEKAKAIDHDRAASDRAAMLIAQAEDALGAGDVAQTESYLKQAHRARPDFIPAAVYLARFYRDQGQRNKAVRIVEKSWRAQAHPDLAVLWASLMPPHKAGQLSARLSWFEKLVKWQPGSPESHIALAGEALYQKLWGQAREHLGRAELQRPSAKIYRLLADLEKRAGQGAQAEDYWLEKAASALPDHVWVCRDTGQIYQEWQAIAQPHGSFNTIVWDVPAKAGLLKVARQEFLSDRL
jgi:HemY protein